MPFDPQQATDAYIDSLGPDALEKAAAYTAGNHWLLLWGLVVSAIITWLIVRSGVLNWVDARFAEKRKSIKAFFIGFVYFIVSGLLSLPWAYYTGLARETQYGRTSQPSGDWLTQGLLDLAISSILGALFFVGVYALIRKAGRFWWAWASGLTAATVSAIFLASPILIEPLFNNYQPVPDGEVRDAIVELANEAGIPQDRIFMFDGSRQSNNFTANVSGIGSSARIAISDVAMDQASLDEVKAVTGHEIGHFVLGHVWKIVLILSVLALIFFYLSDRLYGWFARRFGSDTTLHNPVGLPILLFMASVFGVLTEPATNTLSRNSETAADIYSLQTVDLPDALASALIKTAEYRDPRPGALQEALFYTHPSVEGRVRRAMEWKAKSENAVQDE